MKKFRHYSQILRALPFSIWFNFKYLPFRQAYKLPILLYKCHFEGMMGGVKIESPVISFGMIRLGFRRTILFPNSGFTFKNEGQITFKGECVVGNDSYIICGKKGQIIFGESFFATGNFKIVSEIGITIGTNVLVGWGTIFIDTDFHPLYNTKDKKYNKAYGKIYVGDNNWFAAQCLLLHSVRTENDCVFAARSIINHKQNIEPECLYGGQPVRLLCRHLRLDTNHRSIDYI